MLEPGMAQGYPRRMASLADDLPDPAVRDLPDARGPRLRLLGWGFALTRPVLERLERGPEHRADLARLLLDPLPLGSGLARDASALGMSFLDDQVRLTPRLLLHILRGALG